eukprot:CAMPEP_0174373362 /NCGR_PEP_ID=MMETSP0811_2-20130205/106791_1 /TAXON_ID=73025 ORGANISM="Eutreptiella gymnastica-like, Strain CCMP1594" /NCGR_SAMPLE_ID=MMETSP0811_2 /ASSEMBLY_ACC=CAM_ASM_000667 /LENGTH=89 /DNA_ID=CAMNT_0015521605 /DNA_START=568 /DNA_END=834 /DNA_ORIENTATION=-
MVLQGAVVQHAGMLPLEALAAGGTGEPKARWCGAENSLPPMRTCMRGRCAVHTQRARMHPWTVVVRVGRRGVSFLKYSGVDGPPCVQCP